MIIIYASFLYKLRQPTIPGAVKKLDKVFVGKYIHKLIITFLTNYFKVVTQKPF